MYIDISSGMPHCSDGTALENAKALGKRNLHTARMTRSAPASEIRGRMFISTHIHFQNDETLGVQKISKSRSF